MFREDSEIGINKDILTMTELFRSPLVNPISNDVTNIVPIIYLIPLLVLFFLEKNAKYENIAITEDIATYAA